MRTITLKQQSNIRKLVNRMTLTHGVGTRESACSVAAINLALTGRLTDEIPECMSEVIGKWLIGIQDRIPDALRNSKKWKSLLPAAAGTGREKEPKRAAIALDWTFKECLSQVQPIADAKGFGEEWREMLATRTPLACRAAAYAATANAAYGDVAYTYAYASASAAAAAANAAAANAAAASATANAAYGDVAYTYAYAAAAAADVADAYANANANAADAAYAKFWERADPTGCLKRMIEA